MTHASQVVAARGTGRVAALTFDDGPNPGETDDLLDFLAETGITAVFCVIGANVRAPGGADVMRRTVDALTEAELDRICARKPADPYPEQEYVVRRCLKVILKEEAEHHRYAVRDLAVLEGSGAVQS